MSNPPPVVLDARDGYAAPLRGWGRYARELAERLPKDLVTVYRDALPGPQVLAEQVALPLVATRSGARVIHAPNCFLPLVRRGAGVVTVHDLAFEAYPDDFSRRTGTKYRWITPRAVRSADRVIAVSQATADDLAVRYGVPSAKVRVIPNAPSLPIGDGELPALVAGDGSPYLLCVGDLRTKKNLARVVAAWQALRASGDFAGRLVIAGQGDVGALGLTAGSPLPVGLVVTGYLDDASLDAAMRGAACVVHASLYEGFGLVVVEAMARGVPVAIADATALPEVADDACEKFDPLDVDAIAAAVLRAVGRARASELRGLGVARAATFSWDASAVATADVYRELLP